MKTKIPNCLLTVLLSAVFSMLCLNSRGQFLDSTPGLMQMPTAIMNQSGTIMITNNLLNYHTTPSI